MDIKLDNAYSYTAPKAFENMPHLWRMAELIDEVANPNEGTEIGLPDGSWHPARPMQDIPSLFKRIRTAWLVFTGRADAVIWPGGQ